MKTYSIRPISLSKGARDLSQYTYRLNMGVACESACYAWYIEGSQPKTLVDAGEVSGTKPTRRGIETRLGTMEDGLAKLGMSLDDIEIVILTHLHPDHICLAHLFKKARFIVQKKELDYAMNPHPIDAPLYRKNLDLIKSLPFELIEGEKEIIPGVTVFPTPGHSPGGQSVEIMTRAGKTVITGFCCHLKTLEQTEPMKQLGWEVSAPIIHQDVRDCYDSILKVKRRADYIIANHDVAYVGKTVLP